MLHQQRTLTCTAMLPRLHLPGSAGRQELALCHQAATLGLWTDWRFLQGNRQPMEGQNCWQVR